MSIMNIGQLGLQAPRLMRVCGQDLLLDNAEGRSAQGPFKLLLQVQGQTNLRLDGRAVTVAPGELVLMDGAALVEVEAKGVHEQWLMAMPRQPLLQRYPHLRRHAGQVFAGTAEADLVKDFLLSMGHRSARLGAASQLAAVGALTGLLGAMTHASGNRQTGALDLLAQAKTRIDADISEIEPAQLAQALRVSRRYLDKLFASEEGTTASRFIWQRRLQVAAQDLCVFSDRQVVDVAYSVGFKDASHFSKAFLREHGCSPSVWRERHGQ